MSVINTNAIELPNGSFVLFGMTLCKFSAWACASLMHLLHYSFLNIVAVLTYAIMADEAGILAECSGPGFSDMPEALIQRVLAVLVALSDISSLTTLSCVSKACRESSRAALQVCTELRPCLPRGGRATEALRSVLPHCRGLVELDLRPSHGSVCDEALGAVASTSSLRVLRLDHCSAITAQGVQTLCSGALTELQVSGSTCMWSWCETQAQDTGTAVPLRDWLSVKLLCGRPQLQGHKTPSGIPMHCPVWYAVHMQELTLRSAGDIGDGAALSAAGALPRLTHLDLSWCHCVRGDAVGTTVRSPGKEVIGLSCPT